MHPWFRRLIFAGALAVLLSGASLAVFRSAGPASARETHTVEITSSGVNPAFCQVARFDTVAFHNATAAPQRIEFDALGVVSEEIAPGGTWSGITVSEGGNHWYHVVDHPDWKGNIYQDQFSNGGPVVCSFIPPTPTPTPTPIRTPTPTPSATPTPVPPVLAPNCLGQRGCAVAAWLANDGGT